MKIKFSINIKPQLKMILLKIKNKKLIKRILKIEIKIIKLFKNKDRQKGVNYKKYIYSNLKKRIR
jgi:hypothetical protein